jgi:hypothetical protein
MIKPTQAWNLTTRVRNFLGSATVSALCPSTNARMITPGRGSDCEHAQCFELTKYDNVERLLLTNLSFVYHNRLLCKIQNCTHCIWRCPICKAKFTVSSLCYDQRMKNIISTYNEETIHVTNLM